MPSIWKAANHTSYCPSVGCIILTLITSQKGTGLMPVPFFVCEDSHKKRYEWILRIECYLPNESRQTDNKRIDLHTTRCTGQPPTVPLHPVIPCFLGMEHQEGSFLPSCGIKKIPHMWYKMHFSVVLKKVPHMWYFLRLFVVSKDTTYVVQNAILWYQKIPHMWYILHTRVKKDCFQTVLFLFFECISTKKTSAETVTSVTCFGSTVILPNDSGWGF